MEQSAFTDAKTTSPQRRTLYPETEPHASGWLPTGGRRTRSTTRNAAAGTASRR